MSPDTGRGKKDAGPVSVIGAGSWGTTLAALLASKGLEVRLWARESEVREAIEKSGENTTFLPGVKLPGNLRATNSMAEALNGAAFVVSVVPSHYLRGVFAEARKLITRGAVIVSATKGIEEGTHLTASGILKEALGEGSSDVVVLSGPTFAKEVSLGLPTAVCAASVSHEAASRVQETFFTPYFRVYTNRDVVGVEVGGALKNVIAIASGISDGLQLGHNARAALITRGLAEITRLGVAMGADPLTFSGLSGLGDLVLTCTGPLSRNYTVGVRVGRGESLSEITGSMKMVAEGVRTSLAARSLALASNVEMPIAEAVCEVLHCSKDPKEAVFELMTRELKEE